MIKKRFFYLILRVYLVFFKSLVVFCLEVVCWVLYKMVLLFFENFFSSIRGVEAGHAITMRL